MNAKDLLSLINLSVILLPKLRSKISTNSQINPVIWDENKNSKVCTIKILFNNGASASIVHKDMLYKRHKNLKTKRINRHLWQGPLTLSL